MLLRTLAIGILLRILYHDCGLLITGSTRVLFSSINHNLEGDSFYDRTDLAFYLDNQKGLQIDLQHSGLELVQQAPEQWLNYAETKSSPLAIFQWPDGNKSLALFTLQR